jgi:signal transduction histidine kinase
VPALRQLVNELGERSLIHCQLTVAGTARRLDAGAELTLFRVAQEALRNVERHSGATRATVRLAHGPDRTTLTVADNGSGFELPNLTILVSARRLGLLGMQERARLVGGHCEVRSVAGSGTSVTLWVPSELANTVPAPGPSRG